MSIEQPNLNTTDQAIKRCEGIIESHSKSASKLLTLIIFTTFIFLVIVTGPFIVKTINGTMPVTIIDQSSDNHFVKKINALDSINSIQFDTIIRKAVELQKLLNAKNEQNISFNKSLASDTRISFYDYVGYAVFVLLFGVFTSLYRFHLKEISRQEHYLIGFQRIRIAGVNSSTKYDDAVKIALTDNAFSFEGDIKNKRARFVENPIDGYPPVDFGVDFLNRLLDKFEFIPKKPKDAS